MNTIYKQWIQFKKNTPFPSTFEAAKTIKTTEAQVVASRVGDDCVALQPNWEALLNAIGQFGQVMAFTRNNNCIHERKGLYISPMIAETGKTGLIISPDIDLRFMLDLWASAFAVVDQVPEQIAASGQLKSIQFFDKYGEAAHKIYLIDTSHHDQWQGFINQYKIDDQINELSVALVPVKQAFTADPQVDINAFHNDWKGLTDTHQFDPLLKRYQLSRPQAFRLIGSEFAEKLVVNSLPTIFERIATEKLKIMVFVGNRACVQIHTGVIEKLTHSNGWFNVLDPLFNLHLRAEKIAQLWIVRKPTSDGLVSSIEAYDAQENLIIQLYGPRRTGIPEFTAWRHLVETCKKQ